MANLREHRFSMDESSPNYLDEGESLQDLEDVDYDILSRRLVTP